MKNILFLICIIIIISLIVFLLCKIEEKYEKHKRKKIHIFYINKIKNLDRHIFNNLNNKSSNNNILIIRSCERWIRHWLDKANILDEDLRLEVKNCCVWNNNACARDLEDLGWTILRGKENLQQNDYIDKN